MSINSKWVRLQLRITAKVKCFMENLMLTFPYYERVFNKVLDKSVPGALTLIYIYVRCIYIYTHSTTLQT